MRRTAEEQALVDRMLSDEWAWDFPPSQWEADLVAELLELPYYDVPRLPREELDRLGVRANECHANVRRIVAENPGAKAVAGWMLQPPDFAVHSVLQVGESLVCVTPSAWGDPTCTFMPDPNISWTPYGASEAPVRNGQIIAGPGVRQYPAFTIARFGIVRQRIAEGLPAPQAIEMSREEFDALKAAYISTS